MPPVTIKDLIFYPIKSCGGTHVAQADIVPTGLAHDRRWMVVNADGLFVTQRERPELALVTPTVDGDELVLHAPGMEAASVPFGARRELLTVEIFGERYPALATTDIADRWFSAYLKAPHRLVAFDDGILRKGGVQYPSRDEAPTMFPDNFGILAISEASLADVNGRMSAGVPMNRFRPNIVLSGLQAFEEDYLTRITAPDAILRFVDLCFRCNLTTIDQETSSIGEEPLKTLMSYRVDPKTSGVKFGAYFSIDGDGTGQLRVGEPVDVSWNF
jgi:uncharacterized protein YcbX